MKTKEYWENKLIEIDEQIVKNNQFMKQSSMLGRIGFVAEMLELQSKRKEILKKIELFKQNGNN